MSSFLDLLFILVLLTVVLASLSLAPWVPTRKKDLPRICALAGFKAGEKFYDLGCGDGRLVMYAGSHFDIVAIGIELALPFYLLCQLRKLFYREKKVKFKFNNLFFTDLSNADVVYLFPQDEKKLSGKLIAKLETELKTGARVITYVFSVIAWQPSEVSQPTVNDLPIYLYYR